MLVTAYKCPETGQLYETEVAYQAHQEQVVNAAYKAHQEAVVKKEKKERDEALRKAEVERLAHAPRLNAQNHSEVAKFICESLSELRELPRLRQIPKIVSVEIAGAYHERSNKGQLLSKVNPEKYPVATPASGLEFRGQITIMSDVRPRNRDDFFSPLFRYMKTSFGSSGYQQYAAWRTTYSLVFNVDDFPLIHAGLMHLKELEAKEEERLGLLNQERQKREAASEELKELDSKSEALRAQLAALRDQPKELNKKSRTLTQHIDEVLNQLEAIADHKYAVQEQIFRFVQSDFLDADFSKRYQLDCAFPRDKRLRK